MSPFLRSFRALLWRNSIFRKRKWLSSLLESLLPVCAIGILIVLKNVGGKDAVTVKASEAPIFPSDSETLIPLSFTDYVTALQARRQCEMNLMNVRYKTIFGITGIEGDWSVPFVQCDSRQCKRDGQYAGDFCEYRILALAPRNEETIKFREWILSKHKALYNLNGELPFNHPFVQIFETENDLEVYVKSFEYGTSSFPKIGGAIILDEGYPSYTYTLRINGTNFNKPEEVARPVSATTPPTNRLFESFVKSPENACVTQPLTPYLGKWHSYCTGQYIYNGAITLQRLVDDWIIYDSGAEESNTSGNKVAENGVSFSTFPRLDFSDNTFSSISEYVPLLVILGLLYPVSSSIRSIVVEKELRQRELMQIMSVPLSAIEWSWFISLTAFFIPSSIFVTITSTQLFSNSNFSMLLLFWVCVFLSSISYALFIAAFIGKSSRATLVGVVVYFVGYFLSVFIDYNSFNPSIITILSLHPVVAIGYGLQTIGDLEDSGSGIIPSTYFFAENASGYCFGTCIKSLISDAIILLLFSMYLNRVVRGEYGRPSPLYFPFTKRFWCPGSVHFNIPVQNVAPEVNEGVVLEEVSDALREQEKEGKSVQLCNLTKRFGQKTAVNNLSMNMYSGQVTALLGHNGAGKTTTISMLTGMTTPSEGFALIGGKDVRTHMNVIRGDIGICLQHDCLFPLLTVEEHIQLFVQIKGGYCNKSKEEANVSVSASIEDVALKEKKKTFAKNLSGGMKRKLSVAIAFCGDSKVIFLDEPTSGMDPFSRRFTWNVIRRYRENRCIILTTHFMDEADLLGDRIAIMSKGQLRCVASSLFLKKTYGVGYQLSIEKKSSILQQPNSETLASLRVIDIEEVLAKIVFENVREATMLSNIGTEMIFQLPINSSCRFISLFAQLDALVEDKEIVTYGVSITTLDEVFLMVAKGEMRKTSLPSNEAHPRKIDENQFHHHRDKKKRGNNALDMANKSNSIEVCEVNDIKRQQTESSNLRIPTFENNNKSSNEIFRRHVKALLMKRAQSFGRDKRAWFCSILLPSLVALLGFLSMKIFVPKREMMSLLLTLDDYNSDVKSSDKNLILYNSGSNFDCNPGSCIMSKTEFNIASTDENYFFCGAESDITRVSNEFSDNKKCFVESSSNYVAEITYDGVVILNDSQSSSLIEASKELFLISSLSFYEASIYGALYFNRDMKSTVVNSGDSYSDVSYEACLIDYGNYRSSEQCSNYEGISYVVITNFTAPHAPLLFQSIADEAIINTALEEKISITANIHPMPFTNLEESYANAEDSTLAWFVLIFSFPFVTGSFATFVVTERVTKAKHLQTVTGVGSFAYWISSYIWDILNYQFPLWIVISLLFILDVDVFVTSERETSSGTIFSLFLFGPAAVGFTYCMTFLFDSASACNFVVICTNFFIGLVGPVISFTLRIFATRDSNTALLNAATTFDWCLRFIPSFCLGRSLFFTVNADVFELIEGKSLSVWSPQLLLYDIIFLAIESISYIAIAILIDQWSKSPLSVKRWNIFLDFLLLRSIRNRTRTAYSAIDKSDTMFSKDEDVMAEEDRVLSNKQSKDVIILEKLTKTYANGKTAVNGLSLGIPPGECFGLLGINGAGKTTTMGILTTEFAPTKGDAKLIGNSVIFSPDKVRRCIGYCPQFDAHFENMTGREHVELYASIKGIPSDRVRSLAVEKLQEVGISENDGDRLASVYSGGMKRKLSVACATIGQPKIVFLDEPSTGMDPVSRRDLWKVILKMVAQVDQNGNPCTSVVLTTHSMEECEALCPRIGIMAGGNLRCLGSAQHLKSRFGKGFQLEVKICDVAYHDEDYKQIYQELFQITNSICSSSTTDTPSLTLEETQAAAKALTKNEMLSSLITSENPNGYLIHKNASSESGIDLDEFCAFCVSEIRMKNLIDSISECYPNTVVRERQDNKVRLEVTSKDLRISSLFSFIETNKTMLRLTDYAISQTSLEQVFNMHAAEAETAKESHVV